jgi:hypothetical protein
MLDVDGFHSRTVLKLFRLNLVSHEFIFIYYFYFQYNITPRQLCQANHFSGTNLSLAPSTLMIPTSGKSIREPQILTPKQAQESKINSFLHRFRSKKNEIGRKEAVAYLEICEWSLEEAIQDAMDDLGWESGDLYSEKRPLV